MNPLHLIGWLWEQLPWYVQFGVWGFIGFTSIGGVLSIYNFLRPIAGKWTIPAMLSLVIPAGLWVWSWFHKPKSDYPTEVPDEDPLHIKRLKQAQGVRPKPPTKPSSAFQKWIKGDES